ncbi:hypothetical protein CF319_g1499 [Tilletia indica]|nr:hypothetical protein CF319_g1499 [Tilletia indica]
MTPSTIKAAGVRQDHLRARVIRHSPDAQTFPRWRCHTQLLARGIDHMRDNARLEMLSLRPSLTPSSPGPTSRTPTHTTWLNNLDGLVNLHDAIFRNIDFKAGNGNEYKLKPAGQTVTLIVRPRGWHLDEEHFIGDGKPMSGGLFDFGLYFHHNARQLIASGFGPYSYLPKMEHHLEARLWNDALNLAQDYHHLPRGIYRGTVLIETITAGDTNLFYLLLFPRAHSQPEPVPRLSQEG